MGGRPPHRAAPALQRRRLRRPAGGLVRGRQARQHRAAAHPPAHLAGGAVRASAARAGREGPAAGLVPRPVAVGRAPLRGRAGVRHHAAARDRGGRQQAALLRHPLRRDRPHGRVGQHDAAHRARHPRLAAGVRPLRGPADRLDHPALRDRPALRPVRGEVGLGQRHPQGAPVHRPEPAPRPAHLGRRRGAGPAARHRRGELAALDKLADEGGDRPDVHATLDEMRAAYASFYEEAEAIASSTALASRREGYADGAAGRPPMGESARAPTGSRTACGPWCRPPRAAGSARPSAGSAERRARRSARYRLPEGYADYDVRWPWHDGAADARADVRVPGQERGAQPAVGAAADVRGRAARGARRQRVRRRHRRGRPAGRRVGGRGRPPHAGVVPVPRQPRRHRAPDHPARLGALADALLQLVVQPGAHDVLHEVGRRHGADPRGRRLPRRPLVAARGLRRRRRDPAAPAVDRRASRRRGSTWATSSSSRGSTRWGRSSRS